jgi:hypothetical protein
MAILDAQGRLFGKISLLDLGAGLVILMVLGGIFLFPGTTGNSVAQVGVKTQPVEVKVVVRGLSVADSDALIAQFNEDKKTNIIIRNQPYGQVDILAVEETPRTVLVPQPDGSIKAMEDPRPESQYSIDMLMTLGGNAEINRDGEVILGNSKVKIGTTLELDGSRYNFNSSVIGVQVPE